MGVGMVSGYTRRRGEVIVILSWTLIDHSLSYTACYCLIFPNSENDHSDLPRGKNQADLNPILKLWWRGRYHGLGVSVVIHFMVFYKTQATQHHYQRTLDVRSGHFLSENSIQIRPQNGYFLDTRE
jgi:hypothetical protein